VRADTVTARRVRILIAAAVTGAVTLMLGLLLIVVGLVGFGSRHHSESGLTDAGLVLAVAGLGFGLIVLGVFAMGNAASRRLGTRVSPRPVAYPRQGYPGRAASAHGAPEVKPASVHPPGGLLGPPRTARGTGPALAYPDGSRVRADGPHGDSGYSDAGYGDIAHDDAGYGRSPAGSQGGGHRGAAAGYPSASQSGVRGRGPGGPGTPPGGYLPAGDYYAPQTDPNARAGWEADGVYREPAGHPDAYDGPASGHQDQGSYPDQNLFRAQGARGPRPGPGGYPQAGGYPAAEPQRGFPPPAAQAPSAAQAQPTAHGRPAAQGRPATQGRPAAQARPSAQARPAGQAPPSGQAPPPAQVPSHSSHTQARPPAQTSPGTQVPPVAPPNQAASASPAAAKPPAARPPAASAAPAPPAVPVTATPPAVTEPADGTFVYVDAGDPDEADASQEFGVYGPPDPGLAYRAGDDPATAARHDELEHSRGPFEPLRKSPAEASAWTDDGSWDDEDPDTGYPAGASYQPGAGTTPRADYQADAAVAGYSAGYQQGPGHQQAASYPSGAAQDPDLPGDDEPGSDRAMDQIKDLYMTAEAIGDDNVDKHFDQLLERQRELISEYFKESGITRPASFGTTIQTGANGQNGNGATAGDPAVSGES
jgi:hypothetical protein